MEKGGRLKKNGVCVGVAVKFSCVYRYDIVSILRGFKMFYEILMDT